MKMYRMKMTFLVDVSMKEFNKMAEMFGGGKPVVENAVMVTVNQTVPFIPTQEQIEEYEKVIKDNLMKEGRLVPEKVTFNSYASLETIDVEEAKEEDGEMER